MHADDVKQPLKSKPNSELSAWKARQCKTHPDAALAIQMLPPRSYRDDAHHDLPHQDGLGLQVTTAVPFRDERMIDVLRFLGRVYIADVNTIFRMLYYRRYDLSTTYRDLALLREQRLVWSAKVQGIHTKIVNNWRPGPPHDVFGLSRAGKQLLLNMAVESDARALELLVARDVRGKVPKPNSIAHDLQVTWWCASMVEGLRLLPWCTGVYVQTEYNAIKNQRADAMLGARFDFTRHRPDPVAIPWISGTPLRPNEVELRWALELDNSTESVNVLVNKFIAYRDLHASGTYHQLLNGDVLLVLVVQEARRAAYLAAEFSRAWPGGWGLVSTPSRQGANSTPFGALWGTYFDMSTEQRIGLLSYLTRDAQQHMVGYTPLMTYELWLRYLELQRAGNAPVSLYDMIDEA